MVNRNVSLSVVWIFEMFQKFFFSPLISKKYKWMFEIITSHEVPWNKQNRCLWRPLLPVRVYVGNWALLHRE